MNGLKESLLHEIASRVSDGHILKSDVLHEFDLYISKLPKADEYYETRMCLLQLRRVIHDMEVVE